MTRTNFGWVILLDGIMTGLIVGPAKVFFPLAGQLIPYRARIVFRFFTVPIATVTVPFFVLRLEA